MATIRSPRPLRRFWTLLLPGLAVLVALGVGLISGVLIARHQSDVTASGPATSRQYGAQSGGRAGVGGARSGNAMVGTITGVSGDTLTLTTASGSTEKVIVPPTARVSTTQQSSLSALSKGEYVTVLGTGGGSGSITARAVTEGTGFGGFGKRSASDSSAG
ncbi:hypothetical protein ACTJKO_00355 [Curtobacterium sp. 22159]|uniref:hypothetical protein n=1 Tax=Curtobacterium sp. 22159 TaxID=3453882 RepID=UPI003F87799A